MEALVQYSYSSSLIFHVEYRENMECHHHTGLPRNVLDLVKLFITTGHFTSVITLVSASLYSRFFGILRVLLGSFNMLPQRN